MKTDKRSYNGTYTNENLNRVAFPLGGIGAGMVCLEGTGAISHVSLRGHPEVYNEPMVFSAICVKGEPNKARVLEGPVPSWKAFGPTGTGNGASGRSYGLPRYASAVFRARFPFASVSLHDPQLPVQVQLTGWSPFVPGDSHSASLPVAGLEYRFGNPTDEAVEAVYSFHSVNFMSEQPGGDSVMSTQNGFILRQSGSADRPWEEGAFSVTVDDPDTRINCAWFRGRRQDSIAVAWKSVREGMALEAVPIAEGDPSPGGSLYVPFRLRPGEEKTIRLRIAWYVPETDLRVGKDPEPPAASIRPACCDGACQCGEVTAASSPKHRPWYAEAFDGIEAVMSYWRDNYTKLRERTATFTDCFYDTTLPPEVVEAVAANLTILKSPTVLRQTDGRLWCWEGCCDDVGCCAGSCTHVWNYAQALPHLFPDLERSLRQTEFNENQDERGHQTFRASLPIRPTAHDFHAAADGQLGGVMKVYREWRISGDLDWLRQLWPKVKESLSYCIATWDPDHKGVLEEPHHNTYDIEFWGPDGMCTSFYLGALKAAHAMAAAVGDDVPVYAELLEKGRDFMESQLWNGEYFIQRIERDRLRAGDPSKLPIGYRGRSQHSPEAVELIREEGPKYQYGNGCLSDGVLGAWIAAVCGADDFLDRDKVGSHLLAVHRYNLKGDLSDHANLCRPSYAFGQEGGLLLCSWPRGQELTLPFYFGTEVWTGIEYQVASHLMMLGYVKEGLEVVRTARDRYDGRVRNPFNEYECGHWYARALSSYGLLQGLMGARYDAVDRILCLRPSLPGDFHGFLCTATGFGTVGVRGGEPFIEARQGSIPCTEIVYEPSAE